MKNPATSSVFALLRLLSYVAILAMAGAIAYSGVMAVRYWPGIGV